MPVLVTSFKNSVAGVAGRIILSSYKLYVLFFPEKRKIYDEMTSKIPAKREIIIVKGGSKVYGYQLN
ncbi:MAG: hypothetical protein ABJB86_15685 [Bacteroidota bacterium]